MQGLAFTLYWAKLPVYINSMYVLTLTGLIQIVFCRTASFTSADKLSLGNSKQGFMSSLKSKYSLTNVCTNLQRLQTTLHCYKL